MKTNEYETNDSFGKKMHEFLLIQSLIFVDMFSNLIKHFSSTLRHCRFASSSFSTNFSYRQYLVSDLSNKNLIDTSVSLHGWLQYRRMNSFGVLRDHSGLIQFILPSSMKQERQILKETPVESCVQIKGILKKRPERDINTDMTLGELEVSLTKLKNEN
jgi:hypothetical protein